MLLRTYTAEYGLLEPVGTDSIDVRVVTHDNWTTSPEFNVQSAGGQRFGSFAFPERNLAGLGTSLAFAYRQAPEGNSHLVRLNQDALLGVHLHLGVTAATGTAGEDRLVELAQPFWAEATANALGGRWQRGTGTGRCCGGR